MSDTPETTSPAPTAPAPVPTAAPVTAPTPTEKEPSKSVFSSGAFNKLFAGTLFGAFGDRMYFVALSATANILFIGGKPEDEKGTIQIIATIPQLLLYGLAGSLVDSVDRRRLLQIVKGLKVFGVLLFIPLLWKLNQLVQLPPGTSAAEQLRVNGTLIAEIKNNWYWCLTLTGILWAITVPFAPARSSVIPDVTTDDHRSIAASLIATSGLMAMLAATGIGGQIARTDMLGPVWTMVLCSTCYFLSVVLFRSLPDATAVPGNKRPAEKDEVAIPEKLTFADYIRTQWAGVKYVFSRLSVLGLVFFETAFWTFGSAFYILLDFHGRTAFKLQGDALTSFSGNTLMITGVGLFVGALGVGKISRKTSPILTYAPAFLLLSIMMYAVFQSQSDTGTIPMWLYPVLFVMGMSGGALLGRVDADVLTITDPQIRGRIFSLKALAYAGTIMLTLLFITQADLSDEQKLLLTVWMPRVFIFLIPLAILFSWAVDVAIWAKKGDTELGSALHRFGYYSIWLFLRVFTKIYFRYEVRGAEKIPRTGPVVLCANHGSFADPLLLAICQPRVVQYIMYSSYYRSFAHPVFRFLRCIPVDEKSASAALKAGVRSLKAGACVGIFPEGQITHDGQLQAPSGGVLFLAKNAGATVVPVALKGNYEAFGRKMWFPRPRKITVIVGEPFQLNPDTPKEEMVAKTEQLMIDLARMLELPPPQMKKDPPKSA